MELLRGRKSPKSATAALLRRQNGTILNSTFMCPPGNHTIVGNCPKPLSAALPFGYSCASALSGWRSCTSLMYFCSSPWSSEASALNPV